MRIKAKLYRFFLLLSYYKLKPIQPRSDM